MAPGIVCVGEKALGPEGEQTVSICLQKPVLVGVDNDAPTKVPGCLGHHQAIPHPKVEGNRISEPVQAAVPVGWGVTRLVLEPRGLGPDRLGVFEKRLPRNIEPIIGRKPVVRVEEEHQRRRGTLQSDLLADFDITVPTGTNRRIELSGNGHRCVRRQVINDDNVNVVTGVSLTPDRLQAFPQPMLFIETWNDDGYVHARPSPAVRDTIVRMLKAHPPSTASSATRPYRLRARSGRNAPVATRRQPVKAGNPACAPRGTCCLARRST